MLLSRILGTVFCIVQFGICDDLTSSSNVIVSMKNNNELSHTKNNVKRSVSNKDISEYASEAKLFDNIHEGDSSLTSTQIPTSAVTRKTTEEIAEIKNLLNKLLIKMNNLEIRTASSPAQSSTTTGIVYTKKVIIQWSLRHFQ